MLKGKTKCSRLRNFSQNIINHMISKTTDNSLLQLNKRSLSTLKNERGDCGIGKILGFSCGFQITQGRLIFQNKGLC